MRTLIVAAIASAILSSSTAAQLSAPAAIVEEVKGDVAGVEFMDYVLPGKVIKLGASGAIVLTYLQSCIRETITGGVVIIGTEQSKVSLADIQSAQVECTGPKPLLSANEASQSAATAFRSITQDKQDKPTIAQQSVLTIYGVSPVFDLPKAGKLVIERSDAAGERQEVTIAKKDLLKGRFYDLAKDGKALTPGASYVATFASRRIAFQVAPLAQPGEVPVSGRLLRF